MNEFLIKKLIGEGIAEADTIKRLLMKKLIGISFLSPIPKMNDFLKPSLIGERILEPSWA